MSDESDEKYLKKVYPLYVQKTNYYKSLYGENTILLMQVGSFYEIYSNCEDDNIDIRKISDITQLHVANKKCGYYMAGFKIEILNKYANILTNMGYTCIIYNQIGEQTIDGKEVRKLKEIISPGTNINCKDEVANLLIFYLEENNGYLSLGCFIINVLTNKCFILESHDDIKDINRVMNDILRIITIHKAREVLLVSLNKLDKYEYKILCLFGNDYIIQNKIGKMNKDLKRVEYQKQLLIKAYNHESMEDIISYLCMDKYPIGLIGLVNGIQFIYERNPDIIKNIERPIFLDNDDILKLDHDSAIQINYIDYNERSVYKIINKCITAVGRRCMYRKLIYPITNVKKLKNQYNSIENFLNEDLSEPIKDLKQIYDIERIYRKIVSMKLIPVEWENFDISIKHSKNLFEYFDEDKKIIEDIEKKYECLDIENLNNDKPFKVGYNDVLDKLKENYEKNYKLLEDIVKEISEIGEKYTQCKIESTKDLIYIVMTKNRYETAKKLNSDIMKVYNIEKKNESNVKITNENIRNITNNILLIKDELIKKSNEYYKIFIKEFGDSMFENINKLINKIGEYDILICNVLNVKKYNLNKPKVLKSESSYLKIKGLRNPIIVDQEKVCIKNDISLNENGILLYGINSSGKSCLMKSIGINIILAQCGMYIFCDELEYSPYSAIFTRISSQDNIYRGQSSFLKEMSELSNILIKANNRSLVVGDEVCAGTENISGISIVASSLLKLIELKSTFIFATHLHELTNIKEIIDDKKIMIKHMKISIYNDNIIFDRKLDDGQGDKLYGINICRYLKMDEVFLLNAEKIRKRLCDENENYLNLKRSNYNNKLYMDICQVCLKNKSSETHHIIYQSVNNTKEKNIKDNLLPICNECHLKEHNYTNFRIKGYSDTVKGKILKKDI
tara:strand:- start:3035 stop:5752 length:2718 start_codon:yes stop_codon:yes gene_type:complete